MTPQDPENQLQDLSRFILEHTGLHFPKKKWKTLSKGVNLAAQALGYGASDFTSHLLSSAPTERTMDTLVGFLTIGETYFFRDKNLFQVLGDRIIRGFIQTPKSKNKKINIWSAGCATGEEPYSIAIVIDQMFPGITGWEINILGTDINPFFLEKAEMGVYSHWSLRETPQPLLKEYFIETGHRRFELVKRIRQKVRFARLNLMDKRYALQFDLLGSADIILCRNVLMYFNDQSRNNALQKLIGKLDENGWLITGPAESGFVQSPQMVSVKLANTLFHQKTAKARLKKPDFPLSVKQDKKRKPPAGGFPFETRDAANGPGDQAVGPLGESANSEAYQAALKNYEKGDYRQSAAELSKLLEESKQSKNRFLLKGDALILLARSYANLGELEKAKKVCEQAIDAQKLNPEAYFLQSTISQALGDAGAAIRQLKRALYLNPEFVMAHFTLGMLLLQGKKTQDAKKSLKTALSLLSAKDPDELLPYAEGITVKGFIETIQKMILENRMV
jgi:chemotaxis protein methyltransferase CheR